MVKKPQLYEQILMFSIAAPGKRIRCFPSLLFKIEFLLFFFSELGEIMIHLSPSVRVRVRLELNRQG